MIPIIKIPFFKLYTINDLNIQAFSMSNQDRHQIKILFVDDNLFEYKNEMLEYGFDVVAEKDVINIDNIAAYHVILCDVRGVGQKYQYEGIGLVHAMKKKYPYKIYGIYSVSSEIDMETIKLLDGIKIVPKNLDKDDWKSLLDKFVCEARNPQTIWFKLRNYMLAANISTLDVAKFEHKYVDVIKNRSGDFSNFLKEDNIELPQDLKSLMISVSANAVSKSIGL